MPDDSSTFAQLLGRKIPLPNNANDRLASLKTEFSPLSDVVYAYGCAMYAAIPLELSLKMILDLLQDLGRIDIKGKNLFKGKNPFKESIIDSKAMLGQLKIAFCAYLKSLDIEIPESFYRELDRCNLYRNELAHQFWADYGNAYNGTAVADEAIINLAGCVDVFHHVHIELLDLLDALAKAANHKKLAEHLAGMKEVHRNKHNFKSYREYVEACYTGGKSMEFNNSMKTV